MSTARPFLFAVAAFGALALVAVPMAAHADTQDLYTWAYTTDEHNDGGFGTVSKANAAITLLPTHTLAESPHSSGMEICKDQGYSVSSDAGQPTLRTWDHTTGALGSKVGLFVDPGTDNLALQEVGDLDTIAGCALYATAVVSGDQAGTTGAVVAIDVATGKVTPVATFPVNGETTSGIATDPVSGVTYLFTAPTTNNSPEFTSYSVVDLTAGTVSTPVPMTGIAGAFGGSTNFAWAGDFDAAGTLWIVIGIDNLEEYHLESYVAGADFATATPQGAGILPYQGVGPLVTEPIPLAANDAADPIAPAAAVPALANTGTEFPTGLVLGMLLLVSAGAALTLIGRRRTV
ncbi:MAG: hypothetical protein JWO10_140 [Microbacteriaceae bacterium]|nr:hypothetical protein [Microbacteriaceae bacterium]